ncbi:MAG: metal-dependent hydrolase [Acetobacteraceae bacterium]|nr:metal-dependent hydrolase [Acetobacteraceae bacterium]
MDTSRPDIIRRRVKIDFDAAPSDPWSVRGKAFENMLNALSFLFPAGEKFFIDSVRHYLPRITDPKLRTEAELFIFQEVMHTKEHVRSNQVLKQSHPYGATIERIAERVLWLNRRLLPRASQLAVTCALEHFTAILADALLRQQDEFRADADPAFATLWLWHAVEETEHKAVCFDVYQQVCGKGFFSYLQRVIMMLGVTAVFVTVTAAGFAVIGRRNRRAQANGGESKPARPKLIALARSISGQLYRDYFRRSFHPWDHNNMDLVAEWKGHYADLGMVPQRQPAANPAAMAPAS